METFFTKLHMQMTVRQRDRSLGVPAKATLVPTRNIGGLGVSMTALLWLSSTLGAG